MESCSACHRGSLSSDATDAIDEVREDTSEGGISSGGIHARLEQLNPL